MNNTVIVVKEVNGRHTWWLQRNGTKEYDGRGDSYPDRHAAECAALEYCREMGYTNWSIEYE